MWCIFVSMAWHNYKLRGIAKYSTNVTPSTVAGVADGGLNGCIFINSCIISYYLL